MRINEIKVLYHGTADVFEEIDLKLASPLKDFGKGFYLTTNYVQAQKWARNKALKNKKDVCYVYSYICNLDNVDELKIKELIEYNEEWLEFITSHRTGVDNDGYDIVYDRIADNIGSKIGYTIVKYNRGEIEIEEALNTLKWSDKQLEGDQYCFKTTKAIKTLERQEVYIQHLNTDRWKMS